MRIKENRKGRIAIILVLALMLSAEPCGVVSAQTSSNAVPDDAAIIKLDPWYFDYIDLQEAWDYIDQYVEAHPEREFQKVRIAMLDTGAECTHEDLQANIDWEHSVDVTKGKKPYRRYTTGGRHGTVTAGVVAATSNNGKGCDGVAAGNHNDLVELMAIRVFSNNVSERKQKNATTKDVIKGIDYAVNHGARVINMCLGHKKNSPDGIGKKHKDKKLEAKIKEAVKKGVVVVCSAGNRNNAKLWLPSDYASSISVINTKRYTDIDSKCKASKSSYGKRKNISAPGQAIHSTTKNNGYCVVNGTSYSGGLVTGVVALMLYINPSLKVSEVKSILYNTATDLYKPGYDKYTGYGNVNAYAAVTMAAGDPHRIEAKRVDAPEVVASNTTNKSVTLQWTPVEDAGKYSVYRYSNKTGKFKRIAVTHSCKFVDKKRKPKHEYCYKVIANATSQDGKRADSDESNCVVARTS